MGAQNFNSAAQIPSKIGDFSPKFSDKKKFSDRLKFSTVIAPHAPL